MRLRSAHETSRRGDRYPSGTRRIRAVPRRRKLHTGGCQDGSLAERGSYTARTAGARHRTPRDAVRTRTPFDPNVIDRRYPRALSLATGLESTKCRALLRPDAVASFTRNAVCRIRWVSAMHHVRLFINIGLALGYALLGGLVAQSSACRRSSGTCWASMNGNWESGYRPFGDRTFLVDSTVCQHVLCVCG
jgi:hypothetical protein